MDSMIDGTKGLQTAVAEAHDPADQPPGVVDGQQLALLPLRNAESGKMAAEKDGSAGRGRGRPPGAKNKSTEAWTRFILSQYASPLQALAEMYSRPLDELCLDLMRMSGAAPCAKPTWERLIEVLKIQMGAAKELAPYIHQKQPMAIDTGEKGLINLFIGTEHMGSVSAGEATNFDFEIIDVKSEENQSLSDDENQKSNAGESNGQSQSCVNTEELN